VILTGDGLDRSGALSLAAAGGTTLYDGTGAGGSSTAIQAFSDVVTELVTCTYEKGPTSGPTQAYWPAGKLAYQDPLSANEVLISNNTACTEASGEGWFLRASDNRVVVCGGSCTTLRTAVKNNLIASLALGQAPAPIAVYMRKP
jgi:hypothetical protein